MSLQRTEGAWDLLLIDSEGESIAMAVEVDAKGKFSLRHSDLGRFAEALSVQLLLSREGREARGWVHNEMILSIGSKRRLTGASLLRLTRGAGLDDDAHALLDYIAVYAHQHLVLFSRPALVAETSDPGRESGTVRSLSTSFAPPVRIAAPRRSVRDSAPEGCRPDRPRHGTAAQVLLGSRAGSGAGDRRARRVYGRRRADGRGRRRG